MNHEFSHRPVLLDEVLEALNIKSDGIYIDGTFGRGGHARAILQQLGPGGLLLAMDKDPEAVAEARKLSDLDRRFSIERGTFAMLERYVNDRGWMGKVDGILLDLGVSSPQFDDPQRGFSFRHDGPLDMRMDPASGISAAQWLAAADEREISAVLKEYGEERYARRIARAIVRQRGHTPITRTGQLAEIIAAASPSREQHKDPATRSFQAIRIYINSELQDLQTCLAQSIKVLAAGGRLVVISFHSLEDRIVKRFIREQVRGDQYPPDLPVIQEMLHPNMRTVGKAIRPGEEEVTANPRARSAVLRVAEKL
jgi:16S rRNA (cytosine1402-N4)-methyltransferase